MNFKDNITPSKGHEADAKPLNMVFRAYPMKERDGFMLHAYLDQSARSGFDKDPSKYEQVETAPYLTPKQSGPYQTDGAIAISGKLMETLMEKANASIDPETGIVNGSMTTTMTQRDGQWQPDISAISGKGFYRTASTHAPAKLAARVDRCIALPKEAAKYLAAQKKEKALEGEQMQIPGLESDAPAKAPIETEVKADAPEIPETDMEL